MKLIQIIVEAVISVFVVYSELFELIWYFFSRNNNHYYPLYRDIFHICRYSIVFYSLGSMLYKIFLVKTNNKSLNSVLNWPLPILYILFLFLFIITCFAIIYEFYLLVRGLMEVKDLLSIIITSAKSMIVILSLAILIVSLYRNMLEAFKNQ